MGFLKALLLLRQNYPDLAVGNEDCKEFINEVKFNWRKRFKSLLENEGTISNSLKLAVLKNYRFIAVYILL